MRRLLAGLILFATGCAAEPATPAPEANGPDTLCETATFEGDRFTHCIADRGRHEISLRLEGMNGKPLGSLQNLRREQPDVVLAMNAGMFGKDRRPIGLYVEDGEEIHAVNTKDGKGNFHLKPNGVFWGGNGAWHVDPADHFDTLEMATPPPFATQSGPMLVIRGDLHPDFDENGSSVHIRNGVGVDGEGRAHFVISEEMVSFGRFARFFRDVAMTPNAMYLDGAVSALWSPADDRLDPSPPLGPLIVVSKRARAKR